jgi:hypothetical protein
LVRGGDVLDVQKKLKGAEERVQRCFVKGGGGGCLRVMMSTSRRTRDRCNLNQFQFHIITLHGGAFGGRLGV